MDWIFLIQVVIVILFFSLLGKIYESEWLFKEGNTAKENYSDTNVLLRPFKKSIMNEGMLFKVFSILFGLLWLTGIVFLFLMLGYGYYSLIRRHDDNSWFQMFVIITLITVFYSARFWYKEKKLRDSKKKN